METLLLWLLVIGFVGAFAAQVATRVRLIASAPNTFSTDDTGARIARFLVDVVGQRKTIVERPWAGLAHAFVFWGFIAFGGYTAIEFLAGLGILDLTHTGAFAFYRAVLTPFAVAVLCGIVFLLIRRGIVRPVALGTHVSAESILIGLFIATLMVTFLLTWRLDEASAAGRMNWWLHAVVILAFLALIPASKHFHLVLSPVTVFLKSPELGNVPNLDFEKEQVGLETLKDVGSKTVLDAFTCVECGRCQVNCPAWGAGKELNPKAIILQTQAGLLNKPGETKLVDLYTDKVLWQCTTCGACENQCPVGIEHLPLLIGARRGLVSNGEAPEYLGAMYNNLERRSNIWGLSYDQRQKFVDAATLEDLRSAEARRARVARLRRRLRGRLPEVTPLDVRDPARERRHVRRALEGTLHGRHGEGTSTCSLATANIEDLRAASPKTILTSCPHCVKTIGEDYRKFGYTVNIVHSSVFIEELTRADLRAADGEREAVTYHDPCYLGRYARTTDEPRALLERFGADVKEPGAEPRKPGPRRGGAVRGHRRRAGHAHLRRALHAAPRDRRRHGRHRLPVLLDHAEGRAIECARGERAVRRSDDLRQRPPAEAIAAALTTPHGSWRTSRRKRFEAAAISTVGYRAIAALGATLRWKTEGFEHFDAIRAAGHQPIMAFWHGRILPATYYFRRRGIVVITSENFDGEWIAGIIERFGYGTSRGSSSRGGPRALLQLSRDLAAGRPAGFTVDGPRGPARVSQPGAVWLAKASGHPVLPFHCEADRFWTLRSWDRTQVPKPFARVAISVGEPFYVPRTASEQEVEQYRQRLDAALFAAEARTRLMLEQRQS